MILRNFFNSVTASMLYNFPTPSSIPIETLAEFLPTAISGNLSTNFSNPLSLFVRDGSYHEAVLTAPRDIGSTKYAILVLGSGTDLSYTDRTMSKLENEDGSSATINSVVGVASQYSLEADGSIVEKRRITITNASGTKNIVVKQWGILKTSSDSSSSDTILMVKENLAEPFIIYAGESVNIELSYKIYRARPVE